MTNRIEKGARVRYVGTSDSYARGKEGTITSEEHNGRVGVKWDDALFSYAYDTDKIERVKEN